MQSPGCSCWEQTLSCFSKETSVWGFPFACQNFQYTVLIVVLENSLGVVQYDVNCVRQEDTLVQNKSYFTAWSC